MGLTVAKESWTDKTLNLLAQVIKSGWPENKNKLIPELYPYFTFKDDITMCDGVLLKGNKIINPKSSHTKMVDKIQESHLGIAKFKQLARDSMFWPGMLSQIE